MKHCILYYIFFIATSDSSVGAARGMSSCRGFIGSLPSSFSLHYLSAQLLLRYYAFSFFLSRLMSRRPAFQNLRLHEIKSIACAKETLHSALLVRIGSERSGLRYRRVEQSGWESEQQSEEMWRSPRYTTVMAVLKPETSCTAQTTMRTKTSSDCHLDALLRAHSIFFLLSCCIHIL